MAQPNRSGSIVRKTTSFDEGCIPKTIDNAYRVSLEEAADRSNPYEKPADNDAAGKHSLSTQQKTMSTRKGLLAGFFRLKPGVRVGLVGSAIALIGLCFFQSVSANAGMVIPDDGDNEELEETSVEQTGPRIAVHVDGAVKTPGLYSLQAKDGGDLRINDVVEAAGGLTADADVTNINLAAKVEDGQKVHIPKVGEAAVSGDATAAGTAGTAAANSSQSGLVNINTADEATLQTLSGIGEATAKAIVEDRTKNGPFSSIEDLMRVSGIGEKKFEKIRSHICV